MDDDDQFYDSETEPSVLVEDSDIFDKLNDLSIQKAGRRSLLPDQQYYAVQILNKNDPSSSIQSVFNRIFINKENAMKLCKQDPDNRRFKPFRCFQDAYAFSYELSEIQSGQVPTENQLRETFKKSLPNQDESLKKKILDAERLPFSAPRKPEVNEMRLFIEKNNFEPFRDKLLSNPRFLITAGDAPVIYQEGFRYNALHVCAKENRAAFCQIILNLLSSSSFMQKMYPNDNIEQSKTRSHRILDLYLNTPEKGLNETPLHFSTKFGSYEVTRLLLSIDICCKNPKNKFDKVPIDIICTKATNEAAKKNSDLIKNLFEQCFYVPMFRDDDKGDVLIDKPSPKLLPTFDKSESDFIKANLISPKTRTNSKLAGYVGPVSPNVANEIYERLKSPAKLRRSPLNLDILRSDDYKGYERILRKMTDEMNLPWCEYWAFLDSYCNLKSADGQLKLEIYLIQKKILNIFNSQIDSIQAILNDSVNNNSLKSENNEEIKFVSYLKQFLTIVSELKSILDLKDNLLSSKFETFVRIKKFCDKIKSNHNLVENIDEELIMKSFTQYMSVVIELSRLDKTSKCYFNLYKSSKELLNILNLFKFFENFHMSPVFKKIVNNCSTTRPLSNSTNMSPWSMRDPANKTDKLRKALFNESDDEDEEPDLLNNDSDDDKYYGDADDSVIDQLSKNQIKDDVDLLTLKLNSNIFNETKSNSRKTMNPFEFRNKNEDKSLCEEKSNFFRRPIDVGNKLFMFGNSPSKLDRAVYLAIQDCKIDQEKYVFLKEWFDCVRNFNQTEMQKWRTPMRQNNIVMRSKSFHLA